MQSTVHILQSYGMCSCGGPSKQSVCENMHSNNETVTLHCPLTLFTANSTPLKYTMLMVPLPPFPMLLSIASREGRGRKDPASKGAILCIPWIVKGETENEIRSTRQFKVEYFQQQHLNPCNIRNNCIIFIGHCISFKSHSVTFCATNYK